MREPAAPHMRLSVFGDEVEQSFTEQVRAAHEEGIGSLEVRTADGVNITEMSDDQLSSMKAALDGHQMTVSAIGSPVGKASVTGDFEVELLRLRSCVTAAKRLDTRYIRVFSYYVPDGEYSRYRDEVLRRMEKLAEEAERNDVILVHENESYVFGDIPERCLDLIESVGSGALKICFDPANFYQVGILPYTEAWPQLKDHVVHFHVKDAVKVDRSGVAPYPARAPEDRLMASVRPAGVGDAELPELVEALLQTGYSGYWTLEPHLRWYMPEATGQECLRTALKALKGLATP